MIIISFIIPPLSFILVVPSFLFGILNYLVMSLANISFSFSDFHIESVGLIVLVCAIVVMSQYSLIKSKQSYKLKDKRNLQSIKKHRLTAGLLHIIS